MKKTFNFYLPASLLAALFFCLALSCGKETLPKAQQPETTDNGLPETTTNSVESRSANQVTLCHINGQGEFSAISVNQNAVTAHLAHGDYLPDADGDGYSAIGACTGSMNDCDDTNVNIHPFSGYYEAGEVCDNGIDDNCNGNIDEGCFCPNEEFLNGKAPFSFYFDSEVNDCQGYDNVVIVSEDFQAYALIFPGDPPEFSYFEYESASYCYGVVGYTATQAEYDAFAVMLRAVIAANPSTPEGCDLFFGLQQRDGSSVMAGKRVSLENGKRILPAKLLERLPVKMREKLGYK